MYERLCANVIASCRFGKAEATIKIKDIFVIPKDYEALWEEYYKKCEEINKEIQQIQIESDTLVTRIQLASDKTLQKMIAEVDDMGDISLMDTKLKSLISSSIKGNIE